MPTSDLTLDIKLPPQAGTGESVPISLTVRNETTDNVDLYMTGRPVAFDISITASDGSIVWRRLEGETIAAILQVVELSPGSTLEFHDDWQQRTNKGVTVPAGGYTVVGKLPIDGGRDALISPPAPLEIVAGSE